MASLEDYLQDATAPGPARILPGCVLIAADDKGITYSRCFGTCSVDPDSELVNKPISLDSPMFIASCTKLMTAIAVLQCVEKGLLNLDADISSVLEEWEEPQILEGFDETTGEPILKNAEQKITLRMLLSHQSGLGYRFINKELDRFDDYRKSDSAHIRVKYKYPLLFEPGTSWAYGVGADWAGQMVERVNNNLPLENYMKAHIWQPLGMNETTFRLADRPDMKNRLVDMTIRGSDGTLHGSHDPDFRGDCNDDEGGGGVYSTPADYSKLLIALLKNDGTLLKPTTLDILSEPCLSEASTTSLRTFRQEYFNEKTLDETILAAGELHPSYLTQTIGGLVTEENVYRGRRSGSMSWGGYPNLSWVVDRKSNIALFYASQLIPPGDTITRLVFRRFEGMVFDRKNKF